MSDCYVTRGKSGKPTPFQKKINDIKKLYYANLITYNEYCKKIIKLKNKRRKEILKKYRCWTKHKHNQIKI